MKAPRKLEAEWRAKLAAAGFADLEGADRDGPLSDRGNLHAVTEQEDDHERLQQRIETGAAYHDWALSILHTHRFASSLERKVWEHHANGDGLQTAAKALGVTYHNARDAWNAVKARVSNQSNQSKERKWPRKANQLRALSLETAVRVAAVLLLAAAKTRTRSSTPGWRSFAGTCSA